MRSDAPSQGLHVYLKPSQAAQNVFFATSHQVEGNDMLWVGILLISPIWGVVSTALFMQIWLALTNVIINIFDLVKGTVARSSTGLALAISVIGALVFSALLQTGHWLIVDVLHFGASKAENVVYWIFAVVTLIGIVIEIPKKIRKNWRQATVPGALEADIDTRQAKKAQ